MARTGKRPAPPNPAPGYAGLGRITDTATRETLRVVSDRVSSLETRLATLEETALQVGSPVDAYGQRVQRVANPQQPFDAVNLQTLRRFILQATVTIRETTSGTAPPPPPTPTAGLSVLGRGFALNGTRWDWRGMTSFLLLWRLLNNIDRVDDTLDFCQTNRVTVPRVLLSVSGPFWTSRGHNLNPASYPDYWVRLNQLITMCSTRQLTPELVIFGDCTTIFTTAGERLAFVQAVAQRARENNPAVFIEIANEPDQIGLTNAEAQDLAEAYHAIDPDRMLAAGAAGGDLYFNQAPSDYLTFHAERRTAPTIWEWVALHYGYPPVTQQDRPAVSDEPINAGLAVLGTADAGADRWYSFGALSRILQFSTTFHFEDGLWSFTPELQPEALACFQAWKQALDDFSFDAGGTIFGRSASGSLGDDPLTGLGGALGYIGRHDGLSGQLVVLNAPAGWVPTPAAGWTAEITYTLNNCRRVRVVRS